MSDYRFLVDDASLAVPADVAGAELAAIFDRLSDQIVVCRHDGERVGIIGDYDIVESRPGMLLHELLTGEHLPRDCRVLAYGLLDKCARFDSDPAFVIDPAVEIDGLAVESYAFALISEERRARSAVGALALLPRCGPGQVRVRDSVDVGPAFVIIDDATRLEFYRSIFEIEDTTEEDFFTAAAKAFPNLRFASGLSFRRFEGSYADLRSPVARHLGALNDNFRGALHMSRGMSNELSAAMGIDMSIEGNTRNSERLMRYRDVEYATRTYRCEWHSKVEPHRNRIHVHPGDEHTDDCVLIGIFVDHLPT